jgi:hypothetical protein
MQAITAGMIAYCILFAVLIFSLSLYRWMKRNREMRALGEMRAGDLSPQSDAGNQPPRNNESPHDTPHGAPHGAPPARAA